MTTFRHSISRPLIALLMIFPIITMMPIQPLYASENGDPLDLEGLTYPELEVTPRASERLILEAKTEQESNYKVHLPLQLSATSLVIAGIMAQGNHRDRHGNESDAAYDKVKESNQWASIGGMLVGAGWLTATIMMNMRYRPYLDGYVEVKKIKGDTKRDQLRRERIAEEAIYEPAILGEKLRWISFATNFTASLYLMSNTDDEAQIAAAIAAILSFTPFIFPYRWEKIADKHRSYKKKIYGPVASLTLIPAAQQEWTPGFQLQWSF